MKKLFISLFLFGCSFGYGQDLSLQDALLQAKSYKKEQGLLEVQIQEIQQKINKRKQLPLLTGEGNLQRNLIIPVTPVPSIAFDPNAQSGEITPLKFATDWSAKAGLQVSWDVFNPQKKWMNKQTDIQYEKAKLNAALNDENLEKEVIDLYAQAYLAQQQFDIALLKETDYAEVLNVIAKRVEAGRASEFDKNNALKTFYEIQMNRKEAQIVLQNKYIGLMNYLNVSQYDAFTTTIDDILKSALDKNSDLEQQLLLWDVRLNEEEMNFNKKSYLPTLTLNAYYGAQFYDNDLRLFKTDNWFGNSYVSLGIKIPISQWLEKSGEQKKLTLQNQLVTAKLNEQVQNDTQFSSQRMNDVALLKEKIKQQEEIIKLTAANLKIVKTQFNEGTILITEYNKEIQNTQDAYKKLWQNQYDLVSKIIE